MGLVVIGLCIISVWIMYQNMLKSRPPRFGFKVMAVVWTSKTWEMTTQSFFVERNQSPIVFEANNVKS